MPAVPHPNMPTPLQKKVRRRALSYKYGRITIIAVVLIGISMLDRAGFLLSQPGEAEYYDRQIVMVVRVIDGDTVDVSLPDTRRDLPTTRIRIWGIDCPETAKRAYPENGTPARPAEPFADAATEFTRQLIYQKEVRIILEPHRLRGRYGRLLAHLEVVAASDTANPGDRTNDVRAVAEPINLATELLQAGLARYEDRWFHSFLTYYQQLETTAKMKRVGQWE